jgi:hypothetical protein
MAGLQEDEIRTRERAELGDETSTPGDADQDDQDTDTDDSDADTDMDDPS